MHKLKKMAKRSTKSKSPPPATRNIPSMNSYFILTPHVNPKSQPPGESQARPPVQPTGRYPARRLAGPVLDHSSTHHRSRPVTQLTHVSSTPAPLHPPANLSIYLQDTLLPPSTNDDDDDDDDDHIDNDDDNTLPPSATEQPLPEQEISTGGHSDQATHTAIGIGSGSATSKKRTRDPNQSLPTPVNPEYRLRLNPIGNSAFLQPKGVRTIATLIQQHYSEPWPTWKKVPDEVKALMWQKFQEKFVWEEHETNIVYSIWEHVCKTRFRHLLQLERRRAMQHFNTDKIADCKGYNKSKWISIQVWNDLVENVWGTEKWMDKSKKGKQNRLTEKEGSITKHTCCSVSFPVHEYRMMQSQCRAPSYKELFDQTHRRSRGDGDYVDNKSKSVSEKYVTSMNQKYGEDPSAHPQFDPTAWCDVIGGPITTRTHTYGFGTRPHRIDLQQGIEYGHIPTQSSCASYSAYSPFPYPTPVVTTSPSNSEVHQMKEDIKFIHTRFDNLEGKFDNFVDMIKNMMSNATNVGPPAAGPLGWGGQVNQ